MDFCRSWFLNENSTPLFQIVVAFSMGVIFSPWSLGFVFFLSFLILYEILLLSLCQNYGYQWNILQRLSVVTSSIIGFYLGRWIFQESE